MHASVIKDVQNVLNTAYAAIKKKNYFALEGLSNRLNHSVAIYQKKDVSICAVAVFALSKIFDKEAYLQHSDFNKFRDEVLTNLMLASKLVSADTSKYLKTIRALETKIQQFSNKLKLYHEPLLSYARAKKASHAMEHGLSISQASKLFNVPEWGISKHMGKSAAHEKHYATSKFNKQRIELVRRLFKV